MTDQDYVIFMIATPKVCTGTEAARVQPEAGSAPVHDAFTRLLLEWHCYRTGISWFEAKTAIIPPAVRTYLNNPLYTLPATA